jgi:hypothetical protein
MHIDGCLQPAKGHILFPSLRSASVASSSIFLKAVRLL